MSDPASIDQQIKRAHQVFKEQKEEIELLKFRLEQFKTGVRIFKCSNCGDSVGPVYNVNLMEQIKEANNALIGLYEAAKADSGIDEFDILIDSSAMGEAKAYLEKYK